eukprot:5878537-Pyramimonas_sp.AAC.1
MDSDGIARATTALAVHGLSVLSPGVVEIFGIEADDIMLLEHATPTTCWDNSLKPDASHDSVVDEPFGNVIFSIDRDDRARRPTRAFYR